MSSRISPRMVFACAALFAASLLVSSARADAPDTSTPKKAAVAFAKAVNANDKDAVKSLSSGGDTEYKTLQVLMDFVGAIKRYEDAASKKFGAEGKLPKEMSLDFSKQFEEAEEKVDGDNATLVLKDKPDDKFPPTLKKVDGTWKMDLSNLTKDPQTAMMTQIMPLMQKTVDEVAKDVEAGKYKTAPEALEDLNKRMSTIEPPAPK